MAGKGELDGHTGYETTGHEWDGIQELNRPLPRWWLYVFYACIAYSIGYWVLYPTWPLISGYSKGVLGYSERAQVAANLEEARASQAKYNDAIAKESFAEVKANPELLNFALAGGKVGFRHQLRACHGRGAQGSPGFPNLNDDKWLWGGTLDQIQQTITYGVRSGNENAHVSQMPHFGDDHLLTPSKSTTPRSMCFRSPSCRMTPPPPSGEMRYSMAMADALRVMARRVKATRISVPEFDREYLALWRDESRYNESDPKGKWRRDAGLGRRLDPVTIKKLALYVHSLGGGQ